MACAWTDVAARVVSFEFSLSLLQLAEGDELTWDDGTAYPEPCLDDFNLLGKNQAAGMLLMGLGGFAALGYALQARDKASMKPYVQRKVMDNSI